MSEALKLYAVHVVGPDDLLAAPSKEAAEIRAKDMNAWFMDCNPRTKLSAGVVLYPGTPEQHAEAVKQWEEPT